MATGSLNVSTNSKIENDIVELKNKDTELEDTLNTKANTDDIAIKSTSGNYIQLTDAKDANMLLDHAPVNIAIPYGEANTITTITKSGLTFTVNNDYSVTINGTATTGTHFGGWTFDVISGETYSFDVDFLPTNGNRNSYIYGYDGTNKWKYTGVFTASVTKKVTCGLYIDANKTLDNVTYYPRAYKGKNRYAYVPYSRYTIIACGKNLAKPVSGGWTNVNFYPNNDGSITIKKTGTSSEYYGIGKAYLMAGKRYRFSLFSNSVMSGKYQLYLGEYTQYATGDPYYDTFMATKTEIKNITIRITDTNSDNFEDTLYIQLEVGDYTDFEPCKSTEIMINNDTIFPITGLQSYDGITNVYNSYGVPMDVCYATNESGQTILDSISNINNKTGSTDISSIGDGTITGAIKTLQEKIDAL